MSQIKIFPLGTAHAPATLFHRDDATDYGCVGCGGLAQSEIVVDNLGRWWHAGCAADALAIWRRCNEDRPEPPRNQISIPPGRVPHAEGVTERGNARLAKREENARDRGENP